MLVAETPAKLTWPSPERARNVIAGGYQLVVYVECHPQSGVAHSRVLECRGQLCLVRKHEVGMRLALAELLMDEGEGDRPSPLFVHGGGRRVRA